VVAAGRLSTCSVGCRFTELLPYSIGSELGKVLLDNAVWPLAGPLPRAAASRCLVMPVGETSYVHREELAVDR